MNKNAYWSPYAAGVLLGVTLLAVFYLTGRGLGASSAFSLATAVGLHTVDPGYAGRLGYFSRYLDNPSPLLSWDLFLLAGLFLGALAGALFSGTFKVIFDKSAELSKGARLLTAFTGGAMIGFASRLSRGCTSGVALSGGAQLAVSGWTFVLAMFAAGFVTAAIFRRLWS